MVEKLKSGGTDILNAAVEWNWVASEKGPEDKNTALARLVDLIAHSSEEVLNHLITYQQKNLEKIMVI